MMIDDTTATAVNQLRRLDEELETILTSFDTSYAWNYGSVKEGLRDLYEKAKRDQWNGTTQLAWDTDVDPERGIIPDVINPLIGYPPYERLTPKEKNRLRHAQIALQLSQFLHGEQGALIVASQLVGAVPWIDQVLRRHADHGRGAPRRGVQPLSARQARVAVAGQREPEGAPRRHHHRRPLGLQVPRHADHHRGSGHGRLREHVPDHAGAAPEGARALRD